MAQPEYFFEGYPVEEVKQRYGRDAYRLQQHELHAIEEVQGCLKKGVYDGNPESTEQSMAYLQSLVKKLTLIVMAEQNEGIANSELRARIEKIKALYGRLMERLNRAEAVKQ